MIPFEMSQGDADRDFEALGLKVDGRSSADVDRDAGRCGVTSFERGCRPAPEIRPETAEDFPDLPKLKARVTRARHKASTDPAGRFVHLLAESLSQGLVPPILIEEPRHCAESMLLVLEVYWRANEVRP